ncbi:zincin-like metallopeptidase domain-containing protein [Vibrio parahaemolyticus]|uniref:zincin-like metallopeptidase domain-containing protein n=5 Tax=Vibrio parahaemolyticus TaxID=670 RepID=UPI00112193C4|nr:zincin-like metallopeptidase domain-containing protein [Vibrio parahaemolyticus]MCR9857272.1 zincin-like metallopeptidase domain-containing protein [Vibrio parahaemolyticus]TOM96530.1 antirestriction protein [Vibrio parahaemolyticus]TOM97315.1 antirestriction protein [Vibrio parahaemolyticus]TON12804.1 antirestriction protein [Vibrio parahaemolyticus]TON29413.1 antirestriction protein [Vibrio parahaemolyticus]
MTKKRLSATGSTTAKKSQQDQILDRLFDYFAKPKGEKPTSDNDVDVSFYRSTLNALPINFFGHQYSGINIIMLLADQQKMATKIPLYATFKQAQELLEKHKDQLPTQSEDFDPNKPLKGIKLESVVVKYLENHKKDGERISKAQFEKLTKGMSFKEMRDNGFELRRGLKGYRVFALEKIKHLLPQSYIDDQPYFAKQEALAKQTMVESEKDQAFVNQAKLIIEAMGVPVIERDEDRAYYSVKEDHIVIPPRDKFKSDKARFAVILHELSHSTGHPSRLNRKLGNPFGSQAYAKEELIAETATLFMCLDQGLETFHSHAAYLESWTQQFADQKKALLSVCKQAKEAQSYLSDRVEQHKLKLQQETQYLDFSQQSQTVLQQVICDEASFDPTLNPLVNQSIIGIRYVSNGIELVTDSDQRVEVSNELSKSLSREIERLITSEKSAFQEERKKHIGVGRRAGLSV